MEFLKNVDWASIGLLFIALLAFFRAVAELLKFLAGFLKKKELGSVGDGIIKVLDFLSGIIAKFGFGKPKE